MDPFFARQRLSALLDGELPPEEREALAPALVDPALMEEYRQLEAAARLLREQGPVYAPPGFHARVLHAAEKLGQRGPRAWLRRLAPPSWPGAILLGGGLALLLLLWGRGGGRGEAPAPVPPLPPPADSGAPGGGPAMGEEESGGAGRSENGASRAEASAAASAGTARGPAPVQEAPPGGDDGAPAGAPARKRATGSAPRGAAAKSQREGSKAPGAQGSEAARPIQEARLEGHYVPEWDREGAESLPGSAGGEAAQAEATLAFRLYSTDPGVLERLVELGRRLGGRALRVDGGLFEARRLGTDDDHARLLLSLPVESFPELEPGLSGMGGLVRVDVGAGQELHGDTFKVVVDVQYEP